MDIENNTNGIEVIEHAIRPVDILLNFKHTSAEEVRTQQCLQIKFRDRKKIYDRIKCLISYYNKNGDFVGFNHKEIYLYDDEHNFSTEMWVTIPEETEKKVLTIEPVEKRNTFYSVAWKITIIVFIVLLILLTLMVLNKLF